MSQLNLLGEIEKVNDNTFRYDFPKRLDIGKAQRQELEKRGKAPANYGPVTKKLAEALFKANGISDFDFDSKELTIRVSLNRGQTAQSIDEAIQIIFAESDVRVM